MRFTPRTCCSFLNSSHSQILKFQLKSRLSPPRYHGYLRGPSCALQEGEQHPWASNPPGAIRTPCPQDVTIKNVSGHCPMSPGGGGESPAPSPMENPWSKGQHLAGESRGRSVETPGDRFQHPLCRPSWATQLSPRYIKSFPEATVTGSLRRVIDSNHLFKSSF